MELRPDSIKCVAYPIADESGKFSRSWCGRDIAHEFAFTGLDHASAEGITGGVLLACPQCLEAAIESLYKVMPVRGK